MSKAQPPSVYLEIRSTPNGLDVSAIDARDGLEVKFCAPTSTPQDQINNLAAAKLAYVRSKRELQNTEPVDDSGSKKGPGIVV